MGWLANLGVCLSPLQKASLYGRGRVGGLEHVGHEVGSLWVTKGRDRAGWGSDY